MIQNFIYRLIRPRFWSMNYRYSAKWDKVIREAIERGEVKRTSRCSANVGGRTVWISNFPYGYATGYGENLNDVRPSCRTIDLLHDVINAESFDVIALPKKGQG